MDSPTIVALTILGGVFLTMLAAILKSGVDGAIKMWGVMGTVTGVAVGAITSYYFADQAFETERQIADEKYSVVTRELDQVAQLAGEYRVQLNSIETTLANTPQITTQERRRLLQEIQETESGLRAIENRRLLIAPEVMNGVERVIVQP